MQRTAQSSKEVSAQFQYSPTGQRSFNRVQRFSAVSIQSNGSAQFQYSPTVQRSFNTVQRVSAVSIQSSGSAQFQYSPAGQRGSSGRQRDPLATSRPTAHTLCMVVTEDGAVYKTSACTGRSRPLTWRPCDVYPSSHTIESRLRVVTWSLMQQSICLRQN